MERKYFIFKLKKNHGFLNIYNILWKKQLDYLKKYFKSK